MKLLPMAAECLLLRHLVKILLKLLSNQIICWSSWILKACITVQILAMNLKKDLLSSNKPSYFRVDKSQTQF